MPWPGRALQRLVGAEVRDGEWRLVVVSFANLFLLLAAYYVLKIAREPLILMNGGAVSRSYARGAQAGLLAAAIPAYSWLANRVEPSRLVQWVTSFFVLSLLAFFALGRAGMPVGFAFFVWLGIFSTLAVAQFWSLQTDLMTERDGRRLFPLIAAGGTVGGVLGAQISAHALNRFDPYDLMLLAAAALAGCVALTGVLHQLANKQHRHRDVPMPDRTRDPRGGFTLLLHDRYLMLLGTAVMLLNLINTTGDFMLAELVNEKARGLATAVGRQRFIGGFYADFQTYISVATAVMQLLLVGRLFRVWGVSRCLFLLPAFAVGGYVAAAVVPALAVLATFKVAENSTYYSLQNTLQQALFLPTSVDAKYKAKAAIDTLFVRLGDLGSTALVAAGVHLGLSFAGFAATNIAAALIWLVVVSRLATRYRRAACAHGTMVTAPPAAADDAPPPAQAAASELTTAIARRSVRL